MLTIITMHDGTQIVADRYPRGNDFASEENRNDWRTFEAAEDAAERATKITKRLHIATDKGEYVSPRYDIAAVPEVGDAVSYAFNGDSYPDGYVAKISPTLRTITTTTGRRYYRVGRSGCWRYAQTWSLVAGHVWGMNPHF